MKAAYADPPYLGCGKRYVEFHPDALDWDRPERHQQLIDDLNENYEAWAMSLSSPSLKVILPMCPDDCRVLSWVKPFAVFKPNVRLAYAWEPVILRGGRPGTREQPTARDFLICNITMKKGLTGAKPPEFCQWIFDVMNLEPADNFTDLFPGTGIVGREWEKFCGRFAVVADGQRNLFGDNE